VAYRFKFSAELPKIINLAILKNGDVACLIENRLVSAGQINNAKAAHGKRNARGCLRSNQKTIFVRAAMNECGGHAANCARRFFCTPHSNDSADTAHLYAFLSRERHICLQSL
jgi:hypothetical protein